MTAPSTHIGSLLQVLGVEEHLRQDGHVSSLQLQTSCVCPGCWLPFLPGEKEGVTDNSWGISPTYWTYRHFPGGTSGKQPTCQCRRHKRPGFDPWVRKIRGEGIGTHFSILAWRIPWTEEPGGLQSMGLKRVRHGWSDLAHIHARWMRQTRTFPDIIIRDFKSSNCFGN